MIAIALAVVAVVMLGLAFHKRSQRGGATPPADAAVDTRAIDAREVSPQIDAAQVLAPDPPAAPDSGACTPCGSCKPTTCKCADSVLSTSLRCVNGCCVPPVETCIETCQVHGGIGP